jgi:formylglycine-generating enzyme required for sulfatase activity
MLMFNNTTQLIDVTEITLERIPHHLQQLGFRMWLTQDKVEFILPPCCFVPSGPFLMGSDSTIDVLAYKDEIPQQLVTTDAFQIGKYPVTVAEYACAVQQKIVPEPKEFKGVTWRDQLCRPDWPATSVFWIHAAIYCAWLSEVMRISCRLPTEAEWEKAARGTDGRIYPWGNQWDPGLTNTPEEGFGTLAPIGEYPEGISPYGLHDMVGNVWEWCHSIYRPYPYDPNDGRETLSVGDDRVMRGGAWYCVPYNARTTCRGIGYSGQYLGGGFRILFPTN